MLRKSIKVASSSTYMASGGQVDDDASSQLCLLNLGMSEKGVAYPVTYKYRSFENLICIRNRYMSDRYVDDR